MKVINGKNTNSVVSLEDNAQVKANMSFVERILNGNIFAEESTIGLLAA